MGEKHTFKFKVKYLRSLHFYSQYIWRISRARQEYLDNICPLLKQIHWELVFIKEVKLWCLLLLFVHISAWQIWAHNPCMTWSKSSNRKEAPSLISSSSKWPKSARRKEVSSFISYSSKWSNCSTRKEVPSWISSPSKWPKISNWREVSSVANGSLKSSSMKVSGQNFTPGRSAKFDLFLQ